MNYSQYSCHHKDPLIYGLYKGDKFLSAGKMDEIQKETGVSIGMLKYFLTPAYARKIQKRKNPKSYLNVICLGFDDNEEADERFLDTKYTNKVRRSVWESF